MTDPLILTTVPELERLIRKAVAEEVGARSAVDDRPLSVKDFAKIYGVDASRVRVWCEDGMPHIKIGDVRGIRIWPDRARAWLEENRG